jgi:hypothetical protein
LHERAACEDLSGVVVVVGFVVESEAVIVGYDPWIKVDVQGEDEVE